VTDQPMTARLPLALAAALLAASALAPATARARGEDAAETPALSGTWTWTWKDKDGQTHRHVIEVEGLGTKLAAREIFDDETPVKVKDLTLKGKDLKFTVVRGERRSDYSGKVADADHINGTVTVTTDGTASDFEWKAERSKKVPK